MTDKLASADRLNSCWDALLEDGPRAAAQIEPQLARELEALRRLDDAPCPDRDFVESLWARIAPGVETASARPQRLWAPTVPRPSPPPEEPAADGRGRAWTPHGARRLATALARAVAAAIDLAAVALILLAVALVGPRLASLAAQPSAMPDPEAVVVAVRLVMGSEDLVRTGVSLGDGLVVTVNPWRGTAIPERVPSAEVRWGNQADFKLAHAGIEKVGDEFGVLLVRSRVEAPPGIGLAAPLALGDAVMVVGREGLVAGRGQAVGDGTSLRTDARYLPPAREAAGEVVGVGLAIPGPQPPVAPSTAPPAGPFIAVRTAAWSGLEGGLVLDAAGRPAALVLAVETPTAGAEGFAYALPLDEVRRWAARRERAGHGIDLTAEPGSAGLGITVVVLAAVLAAVAYLRRTRISPLRKIELASAVLGAGIGVLVPLLAFLQRAYPEPLDRWYRRSDPSLLALEWIVLAAIGLAAALLDGESRSRRWGLLVWLAAGALIPLTLTFFVAGVARFEPLGALAFAVTAFLADRRRGRSIRLDLAFAVAVGIANFTALWVAGPALMWGSFARFAAANAAWLALVVGAVALARLSDARTCRGLEIVLAGVGAGIAVVGAAAFPQFTRYASLTVVGFCEPNGAMFVWAGAGLVGLLAALQDKGVQRWNLGLLTWAAAATLAALLVLGFFTIAIHVLPSAAAFIAAAHLADRRQGRRTPLPLALPAVVLTLGLVAIGVTVFLGALRGWMV